MAKTLEHLVFAAFFSHQQHALLALRKHDLVGRHARLALRNEIKFHIQSHAAARTHLAGRAGQSRRAHVLNADNGSCLHGLKAGLHQQLLHEGIAHLHIRPLGLGSRMELFTGHGRAMNAVSARLCANIDHRVAGAGRFAVKNFVIADQSQRKCVHQGIAAVAGLELGFSAEIGNAKAVAVTGDAADHSFNDGVVLVNAVAGPDPAASRDRPEAQRIHHRQRPRAHGKDVAQNAAHAGSRTLERLDVAGVIVALNLEGARPTIANVDNACVLTRPLHNAIALGGQALQVHAAGLVGAMLAPHHAVNAQFGERWNAPKSSKMRWYSSAVMLC